MDKEGYTALMVCCVYGKCSGDSNSVESEKIKKDRFDCCKLLIEMGSNVNFSSGKEKMTPLHWAAYHNDFEVCKLLLSKEAKQTLNSDNNMPVDIAAFCGH